LPTYERLPRFSKDFGALSREQQLLFIAAVEKFVADLQAGKGFRKGLRVKGVQGSPGVYELTWADDGRATFSYGKAVRDGETHVIWHRVGTHDIL
jgi:hypothetical protein